jgi:hypothetical protein
MDLNETVLQYLAVDLDDRPSSLVDCLGEDGMTIDEAKLVLYKEKEDDLGDLLLQLVAASYYMLHK